VRTDSNAVEWVLGEASKGRMLKWALSLQELKFKITHRPGAKHGNADTMSRCPLEEWSKCPYGGGAQEPLYGVAPPFIVGMAAHSTPKTTAYAAVSGGTRSKSRASQAQALLTPLNCCVMTRKQLRCKMRVTIVTAVTNTALNSKISHDPLQHQRLQRLALAYVACASPTVTSMTPPAPTKTRILLWLRAFDLLLTFRRSTSRRGMHKSYANFRWRTLSALKR
jgi:hypothetical protein